MKRALICLMLLAIVGSAFGGTRDHVGWITCPTASGGLDGQGYLGDSKSDSASHHYGPFYYQIPEGARRDTLLLFVWSYSAESGVDLDISRFFGMKTGNNPKAWKWNNDSTIVKATHTTESDLTIFEIVPSANDTTESEKPGIADALKVDVKGGGASNSADTNFWTKLFAKKDDDS